MRDDGKRVNFDHDNLVQYKTINRYSDLADTQLVTAQGCGSFQSRDLKSNDRATIMTLFAVKDPYTNEQ